MVDVSARIQEIRDAYQRRDFARTNALLDALQAGDPSFETFYAIAQFTRDVGQLDAAEKAFRRAIELSQPDQRDYAFWHAFFVTLYRLHKIDDATAATEEMCRRGVTHDRQACEILASMLYLQGKYAESWRMFEGRLARVFETNESVWRLHRRHDRWRGEAEHAILVCSDLGAGDEFMFLRYLWPLASRCRHIFFLPHHETEILAVNGHYRLPGNATVISAEDFEWQSAMSLSRDKSWQSWLPLCSLPFDLRIGPPAAASAPYIVPIKGLPPRGGIGVVWRSGPHHPADDSRSATPEFYQPFAGIDAQFYSLQLPVREDEPIPAFIQPTTLHDWTDTVSIIDQIDLVITVDTAVAHLAGAMGKRVWIALPYDAEFPWGLSGTTSPWYPSATLWRQEARGDWSSANRAMVRALQAKPDFLAHTGTASAGSSRAPGCHPSSAAPEQDLTTNLPAAEGKSVEQALAIAIDHHRAGRLAEAQEIYAHIAEIKPDHLDAVQLLGMVARQLGQYEEAVRLLGRAIEISADCVPAHINLGRTMVALGRLEGAVSCFQTAVRLDPRNVDAQFNLGETEQARGRRNDALRAYQAAVAVDPNHVEAHVNLGTILEGEGRYDEAEAAYRRAIELRPQAAAYNNLAGLLQEQGKLDEALAGFRRALELEPGNPIIHSNLIFAMDMDARTSVADSQGERRRWHAAHAVPDSARYREWPNSPDPERKLRVGYVSGDFRSHSAAYTFAPVLFGYDRERFEVFCYSSTRIEDHMTERFKAVDQWRPIRGMPDEAVIRLVRDDAIDLLVDLAGHTAANRLRVFTAKPAPVQLSAWAGCGTGIPEIDYLVSDAVIVPADERPLFAEQIYGMPCAFAYQPPTDVPEPGPPPALSAGVVTFGCLNRFGKVSDRVMALWAQILRDCPNSRLLLKDRSFSVTGNCQIALERLERCGVGRERVVLQGATNQVGHMAAYGAVDLTLDPFPQNGGVTTLEALWMGVPVVTRRGSVPQARVAASILSALGLHQFIADSDEGYIETALRQAAELDELSALRARLRERLLASPIANAAAHVAAVEDAYRTMWRRWCAAQQPEPPRGWARWRKKRSKT